MYVRLLTIALPPGAWQVAHLLKESQMHWDPQSTGKNTCLVHAINNACQFNLVSFEILKTFAEHVRRRYEILGILVSKKTTGVMYDASGNFHGMPFYAHYRVLHATAAHQP